MTWAARRSGVTHVYPYVGICIVPNTFYHREASPLLLPSKVSREHRKHFCHSHADTVNSSPGISPRCGSLLSRWRG